MKTIPNFADVIRRKLADDPELAEAVSNESFNADLAQKVYALRTEAGLSQKQLADLIGTQQSAISRIEDSDYDGHSLAILKKIAKAVNRILTVEFRAPTIHTAVEVTEFSINWNAAGWDRWELTITDRGTGMADLVKTV